jgi:hypothetical protein
MVWKNLIRKSVTGSRKTKYKVVRQAYESAYYFCQWARAEFWSGKAKRVYCLQYFSFALLQQLMGSWARKGWIKFSPFKSSTLREHSSTQILPSYFVPVWLLKTSISTLLKQSTGTTIRRSNYEAHTSRPFRHISFLHLNQQAPTRTQSDRATMQRLGRQWLVGYVLRSRSQQLVAWAQRQKWLLQR